MKKHPTDALMIVSFNESIASRVQHTIILICFAYSWIIFQFINPFGILITFLLLSHWFGSLGMKKPHSHTHKHRYVCYVIIWWTILPDKMKLLNIIRFFFYNFNHIGAIVSLHILLCFLSSSSLSIIKMIQKWVLINNIIKKIVYFARNLNNQMILWCLQKISTAKRFLFSKKKKHKNKKKNTSKFSSWIIEYVFCLVLCKWYVILNLLISFCC